VRAIVVERPDEVAYLELEPVTPGPADVVVESALAGVCRTDLEIVHGGLDPGFVRYPVVPGHEWTGTVTAVGELVSGIEPGDRVVCEGMVPCGLCDRCRAGDTNLCANYDQLGFTRPGGCAEEVVVPRHVVHRLPPSVTSENAVLIEPAACALRALERADPRPGARVGVIGVGTLGALVVQLARLLSPGLLVAYGIRDAELELAKTLGADAVVDVRASDPVAETHRLAGGGLDVVVESAGPPEAFELATRIVRPGGRCALLGITSEDATVRLPPNRLALGDVTLIGCLSYTSAVWARVVGLVTAGRVDFSSLVTHRFAASQFARAFDLLESGGEDATKIVLEHAV
jgi:L-iditol 2-dehydrogenase